MTPRYLLDASALLAVIRNEPGAERVREVLDHCRIHSVNFAEVAMKMVSKGMPAAQVREHLAALALDVIEEFTAAQAMEVAELGAEARRLGLSLGACVCLVEARDTGSIALTTKHIWSRVSGIEVNILQIRP